MGATWAQLEAAAPELAARGRTVVERHRLMLLGTLRRDGSPRISPVEAHFVNGELSLALIPRSEKASDLRRDQRLVLQSPVTDAADPGEELKIRGRAVAAEGEEDEIAEAIANASGWRPTASWMLVRVELEAVAHIEWIEGDMVLRQWSREEGLRPTRRRRLDMDAGAYLPAPPGSLGP